MPNSNANHSESNSKSKKAKQPNFAAQIKERVPKGPSNVATYLESDEPAERLATGQQTDRSIDSKAKEIAEWDANWRAAGG